MADKRLPSTSELERLAARLRLDSEALLVLVIRVDDVVLSVDPGVSAKDAGDTITSELPGILGALTENRRKKQ